MNDTPINILRPENLPEEVQAQKDIFICNWLTVIDNLGSVLTMKESARRPLFVGPGRIVFVEHGEAEYVINLQPYHLQPHSVLIIPENAYIEIRQITDNFNGKAVSFKGLQVSVPQCLYLHLDDSDTDRLRASFSLLWQMVHAESFTLTTAEYLLCAMLTDLQHNSRAIVPLSDNISHEAQLLQRFLLLAGTHGMYERNVGFYAKQMCLTPNHLSAVVKQTSGLTVMQWLNMRTLVEAQVLLCHTDLTIHQISDQLHFNEPTTFCRFFRRETGFTPKEYRDEE